MPLLYAEAKFAETGETIRAVRMELHRAAFQHEVAVFEVPSTYGAAYPQGSPVRLSWGSFPETKDNFYGYVHHDRPEAGKEDRRTPMTKLVCIGTTGVLGDHGSRSWLNTRSDLVLEEMALEHGLLFAAHQGRRTMSNLVQAAESGWKFLTRVAKEEGHVLFGVGPAAVMLDPVTVMNERGPLAMLIERSETTSLRGTVGALDVGTRESVTREGYTLADSGALVAAGSPLPGGDRAVRPEAREKRFVLGTASGSAKDLGEEIFAASRDEGFLNELEVEVRGARPRVVPTTAVELRGFGRQYDGFWSVRDVTFRLGSEMTTELKLHKAPVDARSRAQRRGSTLPRRGASSRAMRLVRGRWVAA